MAYIVDLTVILNGLFMSSYSVLATEVQSAMKDYAQTGARGQIHAEIRSFVREMPFSTYQERDTIMEKIIDLIRQNCIPTSSQRENTELDAGEKSGHRGRSDLYNIDKG